MNASANAQKVLQELNFDFATFTMDGFFRAIEAKKGCEIITLPWNMPPAMFGAWISDKNGTREYIFYSRNTTQAHQVHIQLHELSHFLFGHPTIKISSERITEAANGSISLPFGELPLRSAKVENKVENIEIEIEAETLTNLIQELVIKNSNINNLLVNGHAYQEKFANFIGKLSL